MIRYVFHSSALYTVSNTVVADVPGPDKSDVSFMSYQKMVGLPAISIMIKYDRSDVSLY